MINEKRGSKRFCNRIHKKVQIMQHCSTAALPGVWQQGDITDTSYTYFSHFCLNIVYNSGFMES